MSPTRSSPWTPGLLVTLATLLVAGTGAFAAVQAKGDETERRVQRLETQQAETAQRLQQDAVDRARMASDVAYIRASIERLERGMEQLTTGRRRVRTAAGRPE